MIILNGDSVRMIANRLYFFAACLYAISLLARTVLMNAVYLRGLETFSLPPAKSLQFMVSELQMLTLAQ